MNANRDEWVEILNNIMRRKYLEERGYAHDILQEIERHFINDHILGQLDNFLAKLVVLITEKLNFESCSIFLYDEHEKTLAVRALKDLDHPDGYPGSPAANYRVIDQSKSMTVRVFTKGEIAFSYNISEDDRNTYHFNEKCLRKAKNWIGLPISLKDTIGVLRVKDKLTLDRKSQHHFYPSDISTLRGICSRLARVIGFENRHSELSETQLQTETKLLNHMNLTRVFMHEVKTPISLFGMISTNVERDIINSSLPDPLKNKITRKLKDIQAMGERLRFVVQISRPEELTDIHTYERLQVSRDWILPVLTTTQHFIKRQFDLSVEFPDRMPLSITNVWGDQKLLHMALNILLDNASKYSKDYFNLKGRNYILFKQVSGSDGMAKISVSNYGHPVRPDEAEKIFGDGERGWASREFSIDGTGVGLYLARRILRVHGGDLKLTSLENPVTFTMSIPTSPLKEYIDAQHRLDRR